MEGSWTELYGKSLDVGAMRRPAYLKADLAVQDRSVRRCTSPNGPRRLSGCVERT